MHFPCLKLEFRKAGVGCAFRGEFAIGNEAAVIIHLAVDEIVVRERNHRRDRKSLFDKFGIWDMEPIILENQVRR